MMRLVLLVLALVALAPRAAAEEARFAAVFGNNAYTVLNPLKTGISDAEAIAGALETLRFAPPGGALLRTDVDAAALRDAAAAIGESLRASGGGIGVFYFAGHAATLDQRGDVYLLPAGAESGDPVRDGVRLAEILALMDAGPSATLILIIDACRTVTGTDSPIDTLDTGALRPPEARSRYFIGFAASPDASAYDAGPFSNAVARELVRPRQSLTEAFKRAAERVATETRGGAAQRPTYESALLGDPVCLVSCPPTDQAAIFTDCADCPRMRLLPGGVTQVGSPANEPGRERDEPVAQDRTVAPFALGIYEVTVAEWRACLRDGACAAVGNWTKENPTPLLPASHISRADAEGFLRWLNRKSGLAFRLPTETEWEYAARAGSREAFSFGAEIAPDVASYDASASYRGSRTGPYRGYPESGPAYAENALGLYHMHGNVWEWVAECADAACARGLVRGGSFMSTPRELRAANRRAVSARERGLDIGLRVARDLRPGEAP